ncbi:hypothetical protein EIN_086810 [Entamoeba invadens IP1]|uniref:hypothetical protein n=1 Tax=Entamoeba invadens IP1 TaxID=370355 RepID=UPI0002C3DCF5|nr:hypothetical protein EIN_086810 [Entamoeba invadens IP1]ELP85399.1 hypothetical protein EIN_086810 [Entamoeba invadens IP1]|eukprot:XP_004184745.1 hypothetical protein EIN_086810 [Entamoeba invadens IP1]
MKEEAIDEPQFFFGKCLRTMKSMATTFIMFFVNGLREFAPAGIPKSKLIPLLMMLGIEGVSLTNINSYVGLLLVDMGTVTDVNNSGYYSGILMAAFPFAQFLSSYLIGALSDNIGKRKIILLATFGIFVTNFLFGFSFNFWFIFALRFLNGMLNGNIGVVKTYLAEITDNTNRVQAFSLVGLMWCLGSLIGSMIGGLLYSPCEKYPSLVSISLFKTYPGLLPQIVDSFLCLITFVLVYFYIFDNNVNGQELQKKSILESIRQTMKSLISFFNKKNKWSLFCSFEFLLLGFGNSTFFVIFPLLMIAEYGVGGFNFGTNDVGYFNITIATSGIFVTIFIFKPLMKLTNLRHVFATTLFMTSFMYAIFPSIEGLNGNEMIKWSVLVIYGLLYGGVSQFTFSTLIPLISNSAAPEYMGAANGVAQSFIALAKIVGPSTMSPLLSWCFVNGLNFPLNQYLPFFILMLSGMVCALLIFVTPTSINSVYVKPYDNEYNKIIDEEIELNPNIDEKIEDQKSQPADNEESVESPIRVAEASL